MTKVGRPAVGSKWTDLQPVRGDKHFVLVRVLADDEGSVELKAIISGALRVVSRAALEQPQGWRRGW